MPGAGGAGAKAVPVLAPGSEAGSGVVLPPAQRLGCWDALARCGTDVGRVAGDAFQVPWQPSRSHRAGRAPANGCCCHGSSGGLLI